MKRIVWIPLSVLILVSCGSEESDAPLTYEDKVKEVCDCFVEKQEKGEAPQDCFMLQDKLSKTVAEDKKQAFINETNGCSN